jgi:DNA-binding response OmpR family regulator
MATVLIVESDPIFGAVLEDQLRGAGHTIELLSEPGQAAEVVTTRRADLVILEAPAGSSCVEMVRELRREAATLPILVLSEGTGSADRVAALRAGVDDYLTKPCDLEELVLRVERLLGSRAMAASVLKGDLASYPLWELIQYLTQAQKSGELLLRDSYGSGRICLHEGHVSSAGWEQLQGDEALLAVLGMKSGSFRFVAGSGPATGETPAEVSELDKALMHAAWLEDELEHRRRHLPPTGAPLVVSGEPFPEEVDESRASLPIVEVWRAVRETPRLRLFDLMRQLPRAPQTVRLAVACLVQRGALRLPPGSEQRLYPDTEQLASTMLVEMSINELLSAARRAGFGTSALPFLILAEPEVWSDLIQLLEIVPGFHGNDPLRSLVGQLKERHGGVMRVPCDAGKLSLHVRMLTAEICARIEQIVTVSAGVLLWLERGDEIELIQRVIRRLDAVKGEAVGNLIAGGQAQAAAQQLLANTRRWRLCPPPSTLMGVLRLLQPAPA